MKKSFLRQNWLLSRGQIRTYFHEFYHYCNPLFTYSLVGLIVGLLDRWLLQIYAGSVQQGFYGLSYQIGSLCFLFTGAMTPLFTRELSIAFSNGDLLKMAELFRRYIPMLYSIAAFFSCFIAVQANKVVFTFVIDRKLGLYEKPLYSFLLAGVLYTLAVIAFTYYLPVAFGLKKQDVQSLAHKMGIMLKFS